MEPHIRSTGRKDNKNKEDEEQREVRTERGKTGNVEDEDPG